MWKPWKSKYHKLKEIDNARHMAQTGSAAEVVEILKTCTPRQRMKILKIEGLTDDLIKAGYEPFDQRMRGIPEAGMLMKKAKERDECIPCRVNLTTISKALDYQQHFRRLINELTKRYPYLPIEELKRTIDPKWVTKKPRRRMPPPSPGI